MKPEGKYESSEKEHWNTADTYVKQEACGGSNYAQARIDVLAEIPGQHCKGCCQKPRDLPYSLNKSKFGWVNPNSLNHEIIENPPLKPLPNCLLYTSRCV